jgi:hypothetical protein
MRKQQSGLINITSIAGYMGLPYRSLFSIKGALELITEALRMEVKSLESYYYYMLLAILLLILLQVVTTLQL